MQLWQREKWKAEVTIVTQRDETIESLQQDKATLRQVSVSFADSEMQIKTPRH